MRTIGFPISHKENENRRALIPQHLDSILHPEMIYIETGYGDVLGYNDEQYRQHGVHIVSHSEVLKQDVICDPKIGDADYLADLHNQTIFGWVHAVQNRDITEKIINGKLTVYAWEDMFEEGRHCFWRNNEIAGEAAVFHAFMCHGVFPYGKKVAVLGNGNAARGAIRMLTHLGADVTTYTRKSEHLFKKELPMYDVIVNAILWDVKRTDHIIYKEDLKKLKHDALIIDVSCDHNGGIETSTPTTIENPSYVIDGVRHYVVDHTPSLFWKTTSEHISQTICTFCNMLIEGTENEVLSNCKAFYQGNILDQRINEYQHRL